MKITKLFYYLLIASLLLAGCQKENENNEEELIIKPVIEGEYGYVLPYADSSTSVIHNKYSSNKKDMYNMGQQALELAKEYFDLKKTYASEGSVLSGNELERFDENFRGLGLLKYKTDYNPEGLNPEKGSYVENGSGIDMYNAILVSDVHEIDFKDKDGEFVGFQFIIVLNETVTYYENEKNEDGSVKKDSNGEVVLKKESKKAEISTSQLYNYGSMEAGQRLINYLRNNHPEVGNLPIQVLLYQTSSSDSMISGSFIGQAYITTRSSTSYEKINQEWVFAPSSRLNELNSVLASQITSVKNKLFDNWPNEVGYYGRVFFKDNMASEVDIEINMRGKTYVEIQSCIQYVVQLSSTISENNVELNIHVLSDGNTVAMIHRDANSEKITTMIV